jgi:nucleoside-diphosphate-sugar epimerase
MNLITGGSGFIGSHIARHLARAGEEVRLLDAHPPDAAMFNSKIHFVEADLRNAAAVRDACRGVARVFHIAALVPISKAGKEFWDVNVQGTRNVLEGALAHRVEKILHMSSSAVYDIGQPNPLTEDSPLKPLGVYARSKLDAESVCLDYRRRGLDISMVRPRTVIGPERLGIFSILFDWIGAGKKIYIIGNGKNRIQFVHVADLADACIKITAKASNEVFNIGADVFDDLETELGGLIDYAGTGSRIVRLNPALAAGALKILDNLGLSPLADWHYLSYHKDFFFDIAKTKTALGWKPTYSNQEMLREAYAWFRANADRRFSHYGTNHNTLLKQALLKGVKWIS